MRDSKLVKNVSAIMEVDWGFLRREVISVMLLGNKSMYLMAVFLLTQVLVHARQQKSAEACVERNCSLSAFLSDSVFLGFFVLMQA